jgi:hypothetical protein
MPEAKLVVVQTFAEQWEAELAKSALNGACIEAFIQSDSLGGIGPHIALATGGYKLLVREEDVAAARDVLDAPSKRT